VISVIQKLGQEDHARTAWDKLIAQEKPVQFRKPLSEKRKKKNDYALDVTKFIQKLINKGQINMLTDLYMFKNILVHVIYRIFYYI
jgi:hypothetical protein